MTEIERSRNVMWNGQWQRVDRVAEELKTEHPESFRHKLVRCRNGEQREIWAFTKVVRPPLTQGKSTEQVLEVMMPS